jgi:hypothetical protein
MHLPDIEHICNSLVLVLYIISALVYITGLYVINELDILLMMHYLFFNFNSSIYFIYYNFIRESSRESKIMLKPGITDEK